MTSSDPTAGTVLFGSQEIDNDAWERIATAVRRADLRGDEMDADEITAAVVPVLAALVEEDRGRRVPGPTTGTVLRYGQRLFNDAYRAAPELVDALGGNDADPFYLDERVPAFLFALLSAARSDAGDSERDMVVDYLRRKAFAGLESELVTAALNDYAQEIAEGKHR